MDAIIDRIRKIEYLGVIIDDKLKFNAYIGNVIKKLAKKYGILRRLNIFNQWNTNIKTINIKTIRCIAE